MLRFGSTVPIAWILLNNKPYNKTSVCCSKVKLSSGETDVFSIAIEENTSKVIIFYIFPKDFSNNNYIKCIEGNHIFKGNSFPKQLDFKALFKLEFYSALGLNKSKWAFFLVNCLINVLFGQKSIVGINLIT